MAQRRMFSKTITNSSNFLMMPQSSQNLYFHLGMNADDDGYCEHFAIMRMTESKPDDLKVLQAKGFVRVFDDAVLVIIDWKENNYLRSDRYSPSKYLEIYKEELANISEKTNLDTVGIPDVNQRLPQDRLGKVRIGKDRVRIGKVNNTILCEQDSQKKDEVNEVIKMFEIVNPSYEKMYPNKTQRSAAARLLKKWTLPQIQAVVSILPKLNADQYAKGKSITPLQLEDNLGYIKAFIDKTRDNSIRQA